jgi:group I intron endonuclease
LSFAIPPFKSGAELEDIKLNHVNDNSCLQRLEILKPVKLYKNLHLVDTQLQIKEDNRNKSAIYCIFNIVNGKKYIGSASTNRINTRFRNHCIHGTGSNLLKKAIDKYGLHNFYFIILEYYPGLVLKENLKKAHLGLLKLENHYLSFLSPEYNLLTDATSSTGFKHSDFTKLNMKEKYSDERKAFIGLLNKNKKLSHSVKAAMSHSAKKRYQLNPDFGALGAGRSRGQKKLALIASKPVILYYIDGETIHSKYSSVRNLAKSFNCCHKTINKCIENRKLFKDLGYIKYDNKTDNFLP